MIDRLVECSPSERIRTAKRIAAGDPAVDADAGSFPDVLLIEAMGQTAALLYRMSYPDAPADALPMLGFVKASWKAGARVGDEVTFDVRSIKMTRGGGVFAAEARRGAELLAEAELAFAAAAVASERA
jgi:3-hydroxymyristoyl/3-hydroxydecanoyl-(acyl carrier protein) dehydratase